MTPRLIITTLAAFFIGVAAGYRVGFGDASELKFVKLTPIIVTSYYEGGNIRWKVIATNDTVASINATNYLRWEFIYGNHYQKLTNN